MEKILHDELSKSISLIKALVKQYLINHEDNLNISEFKNILNLLFFKVDIFSVNSYEIYYTINELDNITIFVEFELTGDYVECYNVGYFIEN